MAMANGKWHGSVLYMFVLFLYSSSHILFFLFFLFFKYGKKWPAEIFWSDGAWFGGFFYIFFILSFFFIIDYPRYLL